MEKSPVISLDNPKLGFLVKPYPQDGLDALSVLAFQFIQTTYAVSNMYPDEAFSVGKHPEGGSLGIMANIVHVLEQNKKGGYELVVEVLRNPYGLKIGERWWIVAMSADWDWCSLFQQSWVLPVETPDEEADGDGDAAGGNRRRGRPAAGGPKKKAKPAYPWVWTKNNFAQVVCSYDEEINWGGRNEEEPLTIADLGYPGEVVGPKIQRTFKNPNVRLKQTQPQEYFNRAGVDTINSHSIRPGQYHRNVNDFGLDKCNIKGILKFPYRDDVCILSTEYIERLAMQFRAPYFGPDAVPIPMPHRVFEIMNERYFPLSEQSGRSEDANDEMMAQMLGGATTTTTRSGQENDETSQEDEDDGLTFDDEPTPARPAVDPPVVSSSWDELRQEFELNCRKKLRELEQSCFDSVLPTEHGDFTKINRTLLFQRTFGEFIKTLEKMSDEEFVKFKEKHIEASRQSIDRKQFFKQVDEFGRRAFNEMLQQVATIKRAHKPVVCKTVLHIQKHENDFKEHKDWIPGFQYKGFPGASNAVFYVWCLLVQSGLSHDFWICLRLFTAGLIAGSYKDLPRWMILLVGETAHGKSFMKELVLKLLPEFLIRACGEKSSKATSYGREGSEEADTESGLLEDFDEFQPANAQSDGTLGDILQYKKSATDGETAKTTVIKGPDGRFRTEEFRLRWRKMAIGACNVIDTDPRRGLPPSVVSRMTIQLVGLGRAPFKEERGHQKRKFACQQLYMRALIALEFFDGSGMNYHVNMHIFDVMQQSYDLWRKDLDLPSVNQHDWRRAKHFVYAWVVFRSVYQAFVDNASVDFSKLDIMNLPTAVAPYAFVTLQDAVLGLMELELKIDRIIGQWFAVGILALAQNAWESENTNTHSGKAVWPPRESQQFQLGYKRKGLENFQPGAKDEVNTLRVAVSSTRSLSGSILHWMKNNDEIGYEFGDDTFYAMALADLKKQTVQVDYTKQDCVKVPVFLCLKNLQWYVTESDWFLLDEPKQYHLVLFVVPDIDKPFTALDIELLSSIINPKQKKWKNPDTPIHIFGKKINTIGTHRLQENINGTAQTRTVFFLKFTTGWDTTKFGLTLEEDRARGINQETNGAIIDNICSAVKGQTHGALLEEFCPEPQEDREENLGAAMQLTPAARQQNCYQMKIVAGVHEYFYVEAAPSEDGFALKPVTALAKSILVNPVESSNVHSADFYSNGRDGSGYFDIPLSVLHKHYEVFTGTRPKSTEVFLKKFLCHSHSRPCTLLAPRHYVNSTTPWDAGRIHVKPDPANVVHYPASDIMRSAEENEEEKKRRNDPAWSPNDNAAVIEVHRDLDILAINYQYNYLGEDDSCIQKLKNLVSPSKLPKEFPADFVGTSRTTVKKASVKVNPIFDDLDNPMPPPTQREPSEDL